MYGRTLWCWWVSESDGCGAIVSNTSINIHFLVLPALGYSYLMMLLVTVYHNVSYPLVLLARNYTWRLHFEASISCSGSITFKLLIDWNLSTFHQCSLWNKYVTGVTVINLVSRRTNSYNMLLITISTAWDGLNYQNII